MEYLSLNPGNNWFADFVLLFQVKQRDEALAESGELQRFVIDLDNFQIW